MHKNENRPGYKNSKVGWIPEGWNFGRIGDFFEVTSGSTPARKQHDEYFLKGNIDWVKTTDLNNSFIYKTSERITERGLNESSCKMLPINTVLVAMYGGFNQIGRTGLLKIDAACNQALSAILPSKSYCPEFLLAWLNAQVQYWKNLSASSRKDPNITKNDVTDFPLVIPPLPEQKAIAGVLECWDRGIRNLELKIEKKRLIKNGLMQRLLSGKQRLKGFTKAWKSVRLEDICSMKSGETITSKSIHDNAAFPCFGGNGLRGFTDTYTHDGKFVLIGRQGALCGNVHLVSGKFFASEHAVVATAFDKTSPSWLSAILKFKNLNRHSESSAQPGLSVSKVLKMRITCPPLAEQQAIADVLSAADSEIEALEKKLALWKEQKKHLLNNLVTGTIRLPQICVKA